MLGSALTKIDIFGTGIDLNLAGKEKAKSKHGALCSIFFLIFVGWAVYHTSQDLFHRKDPKATTYQDFNENPRQMTISKDTFVFAFGVVSAMENYFAHFTDESIYVPAVVWGQRTRQIVNGETKENWNTVLLELERCTLGHFGELAPNFESLPLDSLYCLKQNQSGINELRLQGAFDSPLYEVINFGVMKCNNETSPIPCAPQETIDAQIAGAYFTVYFSNLAINTKNSSRPDIRYRDSYSSLLCGNCYKSSSLSLSHVKVKSDYGWLFEVDEVLDFIQATPAKEQLDLRPNAMGALMDCSIEVSKLETIYSRSYVKIQDILAEVDGLSTSVMLIIIFLITPYSEIKLKEAFINQMFDFKIRKKPKETKKKDSKERSAKRAAGDEQKKVEYVHSNTSTKKDDIFEGNKNSKPVDNNEIQLVCLDSPKSNSRLVNSNRAKLETHAHKFTKKITADPYGPKNFSPLDSDKEFSVDEVFEKKQQKSAFAEIVKMGEGEFTGEPATNINNRKEVDIEEKSPKETQILSARYKEEKAELHRIHHLKEKVTRKLQVKVLEEPEVHLEYESPSFFSEVLSEVKEENEGHESIVQSCLNDKGSDKPKKVSLKSITREKHQIDSDIEKLGVALEDRKSKEKGSIEGFSNNSEEYDEDFAEVETKLNITFWEYLCSFFWKSQKLKEKLYILEQGKQNIEERLDVFNIMKKFREIDKLKALLLENDQLILFNGLPKPEILGKREEKKAVMRRNSVVHTMLRKPKFVEEVHKQNQIFKSYNLLKAKTKKNEVDEKLIAVYNEIINPLTAVAFNLSLKEIK